MPHEAERLRFTFEAEVISWRGPAPYVFIAVPLHDAQALREAGRAVSYGWGMIPAKVTIADVTFETSLFPRDGSYYLPLRDKVRAQLDISVGDRVSVTLEVPAASPRAG
ncbi:hypothetical protein SLG_22780 [Sphingobium sp. SYK-6]|uniref:DUF1905 domain-containing protein n=1 Tax=Sphingobium sp. (strain NBRC 103272 / SYK-6) TaxID=627192 RepID=UPI000227723F|nr:DUF1905 domain-containing protein [Sphingobium sp. SYK-6]BAK66953.1 hypothetical protein SLG_22780 [Sphingobium sp. SYK-6]